MIKGIFKQITTIQVAFSLLAVFFLALPLSAQPTGGNVNKRSDSYVVTTSDAASLRQLYRDAGRTVMYETIHPLRLTELETNCRTQLHKDAEFVGVVYDNPNQPAQLVCATPNPFPPQLVIKICLRLKDMGVSNGNVDFIIPQTFLFGCGYPTAKKVAA